jgi:hypothetical protein
LKNDLVEYFIAGGRRGNGMYHDETLQKQSTTTQTKRNMQKYSTTNEFLINIHIHGIVRGGNGCWCMKTTNNKEKTVYNNFTHHQHS